MRCSRLTRSSRIRRSSAREYGFPPEKSGNTIVVASKRGAKKYCACIVAATDRLDVNKRVKGLMEVSRASFASADETMELTGMMIGGVTPFGLPDDLPIYADAKLRDLDYVILGGGSRSFKLKMAPAELGKLSNLSSSRGYRCCRGARWLLFGGLGLF